MSQYQDVLCGCGWGRLACPVEDIPEHCPTCGFNLWEYFDLNILDDTCTELDDAFRSIRNDDIEYPSGESNCQYNDKG